MAILLQDENLFTEVGHMKYLLHVGNLIGGRSVIPVLYFVRLLRDVAHNNYEQVHGQSLMMDLINSTDYGSSYGAPGSRWSGS